MRAAGAAGGERRVTAEGERVRDRYLRPGTLAAALRAAASLSAKTLLLDVEPLVAHWDTGQRAFDEGAIEVLGQVARLPGIEVVCFTTNSARRPSAGLACPGVRVVCLARAAKPFRVAPYREFPAPGVVIGDQVLTDGLLARRLGYVFLHCGPQQGGVPPGPWLLERCGRLVRPLVFTAKAIPGG
jgi:hypothetical protein